MSTNVSQYNRQSMLRTQQVGHPLGTQQKGLQGQKGSGASTLDKDLMTLAKLKSANSPTVGSGLGALKPQEHHLAGALGGFDTEIKGSQTKNVMNANTAASEFGVQLGRNLHQDALLDLMAGRKEAAIVRDYEQSGQSQEFLIKNVSDDLSKPELRLFQLKQGQVVEVANTADIPVDELFGNGGRLILGNKVVNPQSPSPKDFEGGNTLHALNKFLGGNQVTKQELAGKAAEHYEHMSSSDRTFSGVADGDVYQKGKMDLSQDKWVSDPKIVQKLLSDRAKAKGLPEPRFDRVPDGGSMMDRQKLEQHIDRLGQSWDGADKLLMMAYNQTTKQYEAINFYKDDNQQWHRADANGDPLQTPADYMRGIFGLPAKDAPKQQQPVHKDVSEVHVMSQQKQRGVGNSDVHPQSQPQRKESHTESELSFDPSLLSRKSFRQPSFDEFSQLNREDTELSMLRREDTESLDLDESQYFGDLDFEDSEHNVTDFSRMSSFDEFDEYEFSRLQSRLDHEMDKMEVAQDMIDEAFDVDDEEVNLVMRQVLGDSHGKRSVESFDLDREFSETYDTFSDTYDTDLDDLAEFESELRDMETQQNLVGGDHQLKREPRLRGDKLLDPQNHSSVDSHQSNPKRVRSEPKRTDVSGLNPLKSKYTQQQKDLFKGQIKVLDTIIQQNEMGRDQAATKMEKLSAKIRESRKKRGAGQNLKRPKFSPQITSRMKQQEVKWFKEVKVLRAQIQQFDVTLQQQDRKRQSFLNALMD
ncbi:hypothetical protein SCOR_05185 [Sulfidibacter corallicola]|uniref:Uncharacterized protein n=1 Tax=Sulfidibacter corallicola TaxID=2818388 RepID=A0A8A4TQL9_SULCO|nr:hypothetical protein [Sulfidibacter corallicola]QTD51833.1 hypothetical protein J3U87_05125 [Sulfidibacter corallicola]